MEHHFPQRQNKNALVERQSKFLTKMTRSFLTEAKLLKKFWFWAIHEANIRLNILPNTQKEGFIDPAFMTTPHFEFFETKPDYRIFFPFGCIGAFPQTRDGNHNHTNFELQCMLGIAFGRSEYTNGIIFIIWLWIASVYLQTISLVKIGTLVKFFFLSDMMGECQCPYYPGRMILLQNLVLVIVFSCKTIKHMIC